MEKYFKLNELILKLELLNIKFEFIVNDKNKVN